MGMLLKSCAATFAGRAAPVLGKIGSASLVLLFVLLVVLNFHDLLGVIGSGAILATLLYFAGLFILGWLLGGSKPEVRGVLGLATTARNFGAALVPAASSFTDSKVTIMIIVGAIVCLIVAFLAARWLRRRLPTQMVACFGLFHFIKSLPNPMMPIAHDLKEHVTFPTTRPGLWPRSARPRNRRKCSRSSFARA